MRQESETFCAGYSLAEVMVVVVIMGVVGALAVPAMGQWLSNQRLQDSARSLESAFEFARGEAIRTGNIHLVLFDQDPDGNDLVDGNGDTVPILVLNDGRPGAVDQNCDVDGGEPTRAFGLEEDVTFGVSEAAAKAPTDSGGGSMSSGSTFRDAGSNAATWVMFRPEGTPLAFSSDCSTGAIGSAAGGAYLTNGARDVAIVVTPLGASRLHSFSAARGWSD